MGDKHLSGGRSSGDIGEQELSGSGGVAGSPEVRQAAPRHEEPRKPEPERRQEEDAPRGVAEIDIHSGRTIREVHTKLPWRPPGEPRFDPKGPPRE